MTQNDKKKQSVTNQPTDRPTDQPTNQPINRPTKRVIDLCARDLKTTAQQYLRLSYIATTYNTKQKRQKRLYFSNATNRGMDRGMDQPMYQPTD